MEAVSGSAFKSQSITHNSTSHNLSPKTPIRRSIAVERCCGTSNGVNRFKRSCIVSLAWEGSDDGGHKIKLNGVALLAEERFSVFRDTLERGPDDQLFVGAGGESSDNETLCTTTNIPSNVGTSNGMQAGLFRTPISSGVQSATRAHGLPRPALAVRNLMEQARFAHLCTVMSRIHRQGEGYPFGSLVNFASDPLGHPIFSFSQLAIHTRNLLANPRCTLVVQIPGWSGLSNARVTIFGDIYPLPEDQQEWAHKLYISKHQQEPSQQWGNFIYFRMESISDIFFIGGFGTVAWVNVKEYESVIPDKIAVDGGEQYLKELNSLFSNHLKKLLSTESEIDDAAIISIDSKGVDIRVREGAEFNIQRLSFVDDRAVETLQEAKDALWKLIN